MLHSTLDNAAAPVSLLRQPARWVKNVAQSGQSHTLFGHLLKTVWTVRQKKMIWEAIWFESGSSAVWTLWGMIEEFEIHMGLSNVSSLFI